MRITTQTKHPYKNEYGCSSKASQWRTYFIPLVAAAALLFNLTASAQVTAPPSNISCTSKDLEVTQAVLPAPQNDPCQCAGARKLWLGIINKTGSTRTSFAMWGTLIIKDASGNQVGNPEVIFACASNIEKNSTKLYETSKEITIACNQSYEVRDVVLAWTSASPGETCSVLENNPSTINPKCGRVESIRIETGVNATVTTNNASCTANGSIVVTPFGGKPKYKIELFASGSTTASSSFTNVDPNVAKTFTNVAVGSYSVKITDDNGCFTSSPSTITNPDQVGTPTCNITQPTCATSTATVNVNSPATGVTYTLEQNNQVVYTANSSGVFSNVAANNTYTFKATKGSCSTNGNNVVINAQPPTPAAPTFSITQPTLCGTSTASITICQPVGGSKYFIVGRTDTVTAVTGSPVVFSGLAAGSNPSIQVKSGAGCFSQAASCTSSTTCTSTNASVTNISRKDNITEINIPIGSTKPAVKAYPNPYNDRIRFVVTAQEGGKGSLEIFNTLGQKIKTVHQGLFKEGVQAFEFNVPKAERSNLVYVLRMNGQQVSGKLINAKE